jgi:hypothetical protein
MKFLWSEHVCVEDGKMKMICCKVYSQIEGKEKNLVPKLDFFNEMFWFTQMHQSQTWCYYWAIIFLVLLTNL